MIIQDGKLKKKFGHLLPMPEADREKKQFYVFDEDDLREELLPVMHERKAKVNVERYVRDEAILRLNQQMRKHSDPLKWSELAKNDFWMPIGRIPKDVYYLLQAVYGEILHEDPIEVLKRHPELLTVKESQVD